MVDEAVVVVSAVVLFEVVGIAVVSKSCGL